MCVQIEAGDGLPSGQLHVVLVVPGLRIHEHRLEIVFAAEIVLRQWRADVGAVRLRADESHPSVEASLAEGLRGGCTGQTASDDDESLIFRHDPASQLLMFDSAPPTLSAREPPSKHPANAQILVP